MLCWGRRKKDDKDRYHQSKKKLALKYVFSLQSLRNDSLINIRKRVRNEICARKMPIKSINLRGILPNVTVSKVTTCLLFLLDVCLISTSLSSLAFIFPFKRISFFVKWEKQLFSYVFPNEQRNFICIRTRLLNIRVHIRIRNAEFPS